MSSRNTLVGPGDKSYALHLDREQLADICRHFHWIPVSRGWTDAFVRQNYPGWSPNLFAKVFRENRIVMAGSPPKLRADVAEVWISSTLECLVVRRRPPRATKPAADSVTRDKADRPGR